MDHKNNLNGKTFLKKKAGGTSTRAAIGWMQEQKTEELWEGGS